MSCDVNLANYGSPGGKECLVTDGVKSPVLKCKISHSDNISRSSETWDFPGGLVVDSLPTNAGDMGSMPGPGRSHMPQGN